MVRGLLLLGTAGVVGFAATKFVFAIILPLVFLALKIFFFCAIVYMVLRMVKPELADDLKDRCCGRKK